MNVQKYLIQMRMIQEHILNFLESEDNIYDLKKEDLFSNAQNNQHDLKALLKLISKIATNHHRDTNFFKKIEQILLFFEESIKKYFSNSEIFNLFESNQRILLFLFNRNILTMDNYIVKKLRMSEACKKYFRFEILHFLHQNNDESQQKDFNEEELNDFNEKRLLGENDNYICKLIREDNVDEFIVCTTKMNLSLNSRIQPSIFETNPFLLNNYPELIEYAAFFGSIQIFQYLKYNKVKLTDMLWYYAIHGKNPEIIHLLEECQIKPYKNDYSNLFKESIKCYHNDIADYIQNKYLDSNDDILSKILEHCLMLQINSRCFGKMIFSILVALKANSPIVWSIESNGIVTSIRLVQF